MKKKIEINDCDKFLIIHTAFLGDVAISLELVEAIKHFRPDAIIDYITTPIASEIIELSPLINNVFSFDKKNTQKKLSDTSLFAKKLATEKYDCIISLHKSFRTSFLVSNLNSKFKIGFQDAAFSFFVYNYRVNSNFSLSEHYRVLMPLSVFGIEYLKYPIGKYSIIYPEVVKQSVDKILNEQIQKDEFIVVAPGSVWNTKKWGRDRYSKLVKLLEENGITTVLVGGKGDIDDCEFIERNTNAINLAGGTRIKELIYLISRAKLVVSNDSAPIHFANLVNTPVIAIFGPTSPIFGFSPIGVSDIIIENTSLTCRPCQIHGGRKCPLGTLECMTSIKSELVYQEVLKKLQFK